MGAMQNMEDQGLSAGARIGTWILRLVLMFLIPLIAFGVLYLGFIFLRGDDTCVMTLPSAESCSILVPGVAAPQWITTIVAIIWGVGGVALLYLIFNWIIEQASDNWKKRLLPFLFVGPAVAMLVYFLAVPVVRTFWISLYGRDGVPSAPTLPPLKRLFSDPGLYLGGVQETIIDYISVLSVQFVGLGNYITIFSDRLLREAFRNNIFFWILLGVPLTVGFGLLVAVLSDRSKFERTAKVFIFLPMAISFVGAGVIWNFIYEVRPAGVPQIGLLNAIVVGFGGDPHAWPAYTAIAPFNNVFLVVIVAWLQAGFSMVLFSAALKGIPGEILEASRVDGANEIQVFFRIMIPYISSTIITVMTTVVIFTLKIFDVVWVMTGGQFGTDVIATQFYRQSFIARNAGFGSAIAIVLLVAVIPVMIYNLRQFRQTEAF
ncbi:MAG: sugar ABC transporter permease [Chloroflexi bacterium]|nr:sugar ABC transporter permease [Chloroflexota bacterium]